MAAKTYKSTIAPMWYKFSVFKQYAILPGHFSQAHKRYKGENSQGASCCIMAIAIIHLNPIRTWTSSTLDSILDLGTALHLKSVQNLENKCASTNINPKQVLNHFYIKNQKFTMLIKDELITDTIRFDRNPLFTISKNLKKFFYTNNFCIFECQNRFTAIWLDSNAYFLFDPKEFDLLGKKFSGVIGQGFCHVLRIRDVDRMAEILLERHSIDYNTKMVIYPVSVEKMIKVNTTPPENLQDILPKRADAAPPTAPVTTVKPIKTKLAITTRKSSQLSAALIAPIEMMKVPVERPQLKSLTRFLDYPNGKGGILRASTHQSDPAFSRYQGAQALANAVSALTMLRLFKSRQWTRKILDNILKLGERIHHDAKRHNGQITTKITIEPKEFSPKLEQYQTIGRLQSSEDHILDLQPCLDNYLRDNYGVIIEGPILVAVWHEGGSFFMFDPNERNSVGTKVNLQPQKEKGYACVTWYKDLKDLCEIYMSNVDKAHARDYFYFTKCLINDYEAIPDPWYNFTGIYKDAWILRGSFSQAAPIFGPHRNTQCTANATMALVYSKLADEKEWNTQTIDQILMDGNEFYGACVGDLKRRDLFRDRMLMADELLRKFPIQNKEFQLDIQDCLVNGITNPPPDMSIDNLYQGITKFFFENETGVVTSHCLSLAIWKREDAFYYFDSHTRNSKGLTAGSGAACLLRFLNLNDLSQAMLANYGPSAKIQNNMYNINLININILEKVDDGVVLPPLNHYHPVTDLIAILRSNLSEQDPKYGINRSKQTLPICLIALGLNAIEPSALWSQRELDHILDVGDEFYTEIIELPERLEQVKEDEDYDPMIVTLDDIKRDFKIGINHIEVEIEQINEGSVESELTDAITNFFQREDEELSQEDLIKQSQGILESELLTLSLWRDENLFYLFDPRPRDEQGAVIGKDEWSAKIEVPPEDDEEAKDDDDEEIEEQGGGDADTNVRTNSEDQVVQDLVEPGEIKAKHQWNEAEKSGKACILRFSKLEDLCQHLIENTPPNRRTEIDFRLKQIKLQNNPEVKETHNAAEEKTTDLDGDWFNFHEIEYAKWILRCKKSMNDPYFPSVNRGRQQLTMCLTAICFARLFAISKFKENTVEQILIYGDRLYTAMKKKRAEEIKHSLSFEMTDQEIQQIVDSSDYTIGDIPDKICLQQHQLNSQINIGFIKGHLGAKDFQDLYDIKRGLEKLFEQKRFGILVAKELAVAVWHIDHIYYMFDCHCCGPNGIASPTGVACITRYKNLQDLVQVYEKNLKKLGNNEFEIHSIDLTRGECQRERPPEEIEKKPLKLGGYNKIVPGKEILRGDMKLDYTKFHRGIHNASAPIAFIALTMSLVQNSETWTKILVDEILTMGEGLFKDTLKTLIFKFNPWRDTLNIERVNGEFYIGKLKANCQLRFMDQRGLVDVKNSKTRNLRQGIEAFFEENTHGILQIGSLILALWEEERPEGTLIYLYDPNARGPTGLPATGGNACAIRFCNHHIAFEHILELLPKEKRDEIEFIITPIEIIVGEKRTRPKPKPKKRAEPTIAPDKTTAATTIARSRKPEKNETLKKKPPVRKEEWGKGGIAPPVTSSKLIRERDSRKVETTVAPSTAKCRERLLASIEKRQLRELAEKERLEKEAKRQAHLGRDAFHKLNESEWILRGTKSIEPYRDGATNVVAFVMLQSLSPDKWSGKYIDGILSTGNQLYTDSFLAYKSPTRQLPLNYILRKFFIKKVKVTVKLYKPIVVANFTYAQVTEYFQNYFQQESIAILMFKEKLVTVYFKTGYYYLFDPYCRNLNGSPVLSDLSRITFRNNNNNKDSSMIKGGAVIMKFTSLDAMAKKIVDNLLFGEDEQETADQFSIVMAKLIDIKKT